MQHPKDAVLVPTRYVEHLPDLIEVGDYDDPPEQQRIRLQIRVTEGGVEVLGDSMYPMLLEELLVGLGAEEMERMLCG